MARQTPEAVLDFLRSRGYTIETIPTLREIQSLVGGALSTISKAVAIYRDELTKDAREPMPTEFQAIFMQAAKTAWSVSIATASKAADGARRDAEGALDQMRKECDRLDGLNAELRAELAAVRAELKNANDAVAEQKARAKVSDENAERLVEDVQRLREALAKAREEKAEAVGALRALKESGRAA